GKATGNGAPVTFTRSVPGGLAIPDDNFNGVTDTFAISQDMQIADLKFRLDELDHTFTGDLTVELKAPNGYGTDLIYVRGLFIGDGDGDNFINTVIDGSSTNDLNLAGSAQAPFTGSWAPAFNSSIWSLFGIPNLGPDPVGQLSRLNGLSTQGNWQVHVTDEAEADTGTLKTWSLIVTPVAFTCTPFVPPPPPFNTCLQDDHTGDYIQWNSTTGAYTFVHCGTGGFTLNGTGTVSLVSNMKILQDNKTDRRITASFSNSQLTGRATIVVISSPGVSRTFSISQTRTHPTCTCAAS
ncbi:MAG: proprotein convertase P-domain-containing protein, partial [Blastocatellia bacterium]